MAALALQLRAKCRIHGRNPTLVHLFSSSSGGGDDDGKEESHPSPLSEVRASLRQSPPPTPRPRLSPPSHTNAFKTGALDDIRKSLSQYSAPSSAQTRASSPQQPVSFRELYDRNVLRKGGGEGAATPNIASFEAIRQNLKKIAPNDKFRGPGKVAIDPLSLKSFKESLQMKPNANANTASPGKGSSVFLGESEMALLRKSVKANIDPKSQPARNYLLRAYQYEELGEKLRKLRPADAAAVGKNWFSLSELNKRLQKLREIEEKESASSIGGLNFADLRSSLTTLQNDAEEKTKKSSLQRLDILGHLGGTPSYMLSSPKEQLVEKFFHPDNMSSAEKLKLELEKVRDEFKMSESDCGSSRVQVAQLTTKIKHLSSVLHKKDKHSRKGLQEMVQKRKKLLRYLRRTDWDSYCLCLSKLGLRDNPDYKN